MNFRAIYLFNIFYTICATDLAVIYKHGVYSLKDADIISPKSPLNPESLKLQLPRNLSYPIALTQDPDSGKLFVSDANNKRVEIFSLLVSDVNVTMEALVPKKSKSAINTVDYNPLRHQLVWTDSVKHGIYNVNITSSLSPSLPNLITSKKVHKPRGIAVDFCNNIIYWTERDERMPTIEKYDMNDLTFQVLKESKNNSYFQGITYDVFNNELIWAETSSDDENNSSCAIVAKSLHSGNEVVVGSFKRCYPFSLTSDKEYIYWSDWARHGIMRLARNTNGNPGGSNLVKLINTPPIRTGAGLHHGAFGIVKLLSHTKILQYCLSSFIINNNTKNNNGNEAPQHDSSISSENIKPTEKGREDSKGPQDKDAYRTLPLDSADLEFTNSVLYQKLLIIIIILVLLCLFFFGTTVILLIRSRLGEFRLKKELKLVSPSHSPFKKSRSYKRFGPKPSLLDPEMCDHSNDGISIDIEDCCQMTLCDTPCYTSMKKEGKNYKKNST